MGTYKAESTMNIDERRSPPKPSSAYIVSRVVEIEGARGRHGPGL